jgi:hypothetical protein
LGLSKDRRGEHGSDAQGKNGRDRFHGDFLHLLCQPSKRSLWRRVPTAVVRGKPRAKKFEPGGGTGLGRA